MKNILVFIFLVFIFWSCRDLQEKDITNDQVELISPPDKYRSVILNQVFYWTPVDGASAYRIQIAENNFFPDSMMLVMDSVTTKNQVSKFLPYGKKYQWRVMALNGGYEGTFTVPRTLYIDSSAVIAFQTVKLTYPSISQPYLNTQQIDFSWVSLPQAAFYYFSIDSGATEKVLLPPVKTTSTNYSYTLPKKEGSYTYNVIGNDNTNSSKNSSGTFYLDMTSPSIELLSPANRDNSSLRNGKISLKWKTTDASPTISSVFVFTDSSGKVAYSEYSGGKINNSGTEILTLPAISDTLYWYIHAKDIAGNPQTVSPMRRLFMQP